MEPPTEETMVRVFGRRMPLGDFRPWVRFLIMLGMILAVGSAARSLSRRLRDAKIQERVQAFLEADEKVTLQFESLVSLRGHPDPRILQNGIPASALRSAGGFVCDDRGIPLFGAVARAFGREARSQADGRFCIDGLPARGSLTLQIIPPESRVDLQSVTIQDLGPGMPGFETACGVIHLPKSAAERVAAPAPPEPQGSIMTFIIPPAAGEEETLALHDPWQRDGVSSKNKPGATGTRVRDLVWTTESQVPRLGPQRSFEQPPSAPVVASGSTVSVQVDGPQPALDQPYCVLDIYSSGVSIAGRLESGATGAKFVFTDIPPGEHRLAAGARGALPAFIEFTLPLPNGAPIIPISLEPAARIDIEAQCRGGVLPPGSAVRIHSAGLQRCIFAVPPSGKLSLDGLPPSTLRFDLLVPSGVAGPSTLQAAPLERVGASVLRTLEPGAHNTRVVLFVKGEELQQKFLCRGTTRPGALVYKSGARFDEPFSYTKADALGGFEIFARPGQRIFAATDLARNRVPFASGVAAPAVTLADTSSLIVETTPHAPVEWILTGDTIVGRASLNGVADGNGRIQFDGVAAGVEGLVFVEVELGTIECPVARLEAGKKLTIEVVAQDGAVRR